MDVASGALAVISLTIQLLQTGEKIRKFLSGVQDAPSDVVKLAQTLDQLNSSLKQVSYLLEQQYLVLRLPGSPVFITNALENCERRVKALDDFVQKAKTSMKHRNRVQRSWAAMSFVFKKEDIQEMQCQLRDAENGLQTAMTSNLWQLQMHSISISSSGGLKAKTYEEPAPKAPMKSLSDLERVQNPSSIENAIFRNTSKKTSFVRYRGFFGSVSIHTKSELPRRSNPLETGNVAIINEKTITVMPAFLRKTLELRFLHSFGKISRTLSTYPTLEDTAPIFQICKSGDLIGLQVALSSGSVSPFVLDEMGQSLLHYAAMNKRAEMCALLVQLGLDLTHRCMYGNKAMYWSYYEPERTLDTLRLLTQGHNEISRQEMIQVWIYGGVTVEVAKYMLSQDLIQSDFDISNDTDFFFVLGAALRQYVAEPSLWESFLRFLLRKKGSLPILLPGKWILHTEPDYFDSEGCSDVGHPCKIVICGTPLDKLFSVNKSPVQGKAAADGWLDILSSEGHDIVAYLEAESAVHASQMQLSYHFKRSYDVPRQLIFHWGSSPSVSWDWWIDPNSSTYLVREEFKQMVGLSSRWRDRGEDWPFMYPVWSGGYYEYELERKLLCGRAQERANRRMKKKLAKAARAQGFKKQDQMPGAWPT